MFWIIEPLDYRHAIDYMRTSCTITLYFHDLLKG